MWSSRIRNKSVPNCRVWFPRVQFTLSVNWWTGTKVVVERVKGTRLSSPFRRTAGTLEVPASWPPWRTKPQRNSLTSLGERIEVSPTVEPLLLSRLPVVLRLPAPKQHFRTAGGDVPVEPGDVGVETGVGIGGEAITENVRTVARIFVGKRILPENVLDRRIGSDSQRVHGPDLCRTEGVIAGRNAGHSVNRTTRTRGCIEGAVCIALT